MNDGFDIGDSFGRGMDRFFEYLPQVFGALFILLIGYIIATVLKRIVRTALKKLRFDRALHTSPAGSYINRIIESPSHFVGRIVFWFVWIGFISLAVSALNLPALNAFVSAIYGYVPNIIAAIIIFLVASAISAGAAAFTQRVMGNTPTAKLIKAVIPAITLSIAVFMILNQLRIATDIVNITYTAIMGSVALGLALAFGLGGRDVAARILEQAYEAGLQNADQAKADMKRAKDNTKEELSRTARRNTR
jgi:hypothetical protein